jgi:hypothetical protein
MSKQVELYSDKSFTVYKELSFVDKSLDIEKAKVIATTELIRILPTWTSKSVKIRKGTHAYAEEVLSWPTIKQFIKQRVIKVISGDYEEDSVDPKPQKIVKPTKEHQSLEDLVPGN